MTQEIILHQKAVIKHDLKTIGRVVDEQLAEANIDKLVANEDTVKFLKTLRAKLNKDFQNYEDQRKGIKKALMVPYDEFENVYKIEVSGKFTDADKKLKTLIDSVEMKVKQAIKEKLDAYFDELKEVHSIDFVKFADTGVIITLSSSLRKDKQAISSFFEKVKGDLEIIELQANKEEIFVEYQKDLNCSRAIKDVQERVYLERRQKEINRQNEQDRRRRALLSLSFVANQDKKTHIHSLNQEITISFDEVENLEAGEFDLRINELQKLIEQQNKVTAPVEVIPAAVGPQILTARFEVSGTKEELMNLKNFLEQNKLTFKNI